MPRCAWIGGVHSVSPTMTKKKPHSHRETRNSPTIPRNAIGRRDTRDSKFINGWLKNRKRGAPLKIALWTTTNKKKKVKKTTASLSVAAMVFPVTASAAVTSSTTAVNTTSTNGDATASPSKSKQSRNHSGVLQKYSCSLLKASTQSDYTQEQIQQLESWTLQISAGPCRRRKIERPQPTIRIVGYHHSKG